MDIVSRLLTRSNLEWASLFVGFAVIWMVSGFFVQEPSPPALIEKKDTVVRVIDQKAENFSKEIVVKGFTKADKKVLVKSETSGKIVVGKSGKINGKINCSNADISGSISGKIEVNEVLSLMSESLIEGDIVTGKLSVEEGAQVEASISMKSGKQLKAVESKTENKTQSEKTA